MVYLIHAQVTSAASWFQRTKYPVFDVTPCDLRVPRGTIVFPSLMFPVRSCDLQAIPFTITVVCDFLLQAKAKQIWYIEQSAV